MRRRSRSPSILRSMRMQRRPSRAARRTAALAAVALAAATLTLSATVQGAGESPLRAAAGAWHAVFGDRPQPVPNGKQRVLVILASPSLADRMTAAEKPPRPEVQRRWTAEAEGTQRLLLAGLRKRGVSLRRDHIFTRTFNGFSARVGPRTYAELERAHGVAGVYPVRTVYPAEAQLPPELAEGRAPGGQISLPGFDGSGVTVALLDGGLDGRDPGLRGHVLRGYDLVDGDRRLAPSAMPERPTLVDTHATRMAG